MGIKIDGRIVVTEIRPETLEDMRFWELFYPGRIARDRRRALLNPTRQREYVQRVKTEVLTHYSNGALACVRCGFTDLRALSIDHISGNGYEERKRLGNPGGTEIYYRLKRLGFPEGYQTLCMNCQFIKRYENNEFPKRNKKNGE